MRRIPGPRGTSLPRLMRIFGRLPSSDGYSEIPDVLCNVSVTTSIVPVAVATCPLEECRIRNLFSHLLGIGNVKEAVSSELPLFRVVRAK